MSFSFSRRQNATEPVQYLCHYKIYSLIPCLETKEQISACHELSWNIMDYIIAWVSTGLLSGGKKILLTLFYDYQQGNVKRIISSIYKVWGP